MTVLKKVCDVLGVTMVKIACRMIRYSRAGIENEEVKNLDWHDMNTLRGVTAHYDDGFISEIGHMTVFTNTNLQLF